MGAGQRLIQVCKDPKVAKRVMLKIWKSFEDFGDVCKQLGQGRKLVTEDFWVRYLATTAKRNRQLSSVHIAREFVAAVGTPGESNTRSGNRCKTWISSFSPPQMVVNAGSPGQSNTQSGKSL
ncbi:hypothetical protein AVEN_81499-1 [Araneus ventricosus]|uniref:Uncharacterized protein n=1 Tax=Araneus ventricosus TaxID=182803 RepID=A0A4Y2E4I9_ARAVE|nr:hypothetical protein AVEN_81499-1 [Araneus ventricosus]